MPEVVGIEKLLTILPSKRFGKHRCYGRGMYAFSVFGDEDIFLVFLPFGVACFGEVSYGEFLIYSGIYRRDNVTGKVKHYREPYMIPYNPRTEAQQANRQKLADGVVAWKALTPDEKNQYNIKAKGRRMSGYNLFLKEYLLSH